MAAQDPQQNPQDPTKPVVPESGTQPDPGTGQPPQAYPGQADVPPPPPSEPQPPPPSPTSQPSPGQAQPAQPPQPPPVVLQEEPGGPEAAPPEPPPAATPPPAQGPSDSDIPTQVISTDEGGRKLPIKKILIGAVVLLILAAVGFTAWRFLVSREGPAEAPSGEPAQEKKTTLTYWGLWEDEEVVSGVIAEYEEQNPSIEIKYVKQAKEDYRERLINSLARADGPDIFRYHNSWVPMLSGNLAPLPPNVLDAAVYSETFYPVAAETLRTGANIVGIPLMFDGLALYINEDLFAQAGKTAPTTWDELRQTALELTVRDEEGNIQQAGAALGRPDNVDHWQDILALMMLQNGADLTNPTGKLAEDSLAFFAIFSVTDKVWDNTLPPSTQAFASGKLAMYFGPSWRVFEIKRINPTLKFRVVPVPQLPKTNPSEPDINWASFWAEGVWNKSKAQEEAWEFLKFLSSRTSLQKMYQEASKTRLFGEPYPRADMAQLLENDPLVGAYIKQAPTAKSWYLASRTFDGPTGINSRISAYFEDAVNGVVNEGKEPTEVLTTVAQGVKEVLQSYNVSR